MRIQFLLVLLLETEDDLDGTTSSGDFAGFADDDLRGKSGGVSDDNY
jgi:hypothetical protein